MTAWRWMNRKGVQRKPSTRTLITAIAIFSLMTQTGFAFAQSPGTEQAATVRGDAAMSALFGHVKDMPVRFLLARFIATDDKVNITIARCRWSAAGCGRNS